jgi:raffinose/stachyose/melibiose transport system substrate-binding protein
MRKESVFCGRNKITIEREKGVMIVGIKKRFSKVLAMVTLAGTLILTGCGGSSESSNSSDKITIDIMQGKVEFHSQFEELAEVYEKENPEVDINITSVGGGTDYLSQLKTKFASGDEPAIFSLFGPVEVEQFKDDITDLSDMKAVELALEGTLEAVTTEDGQVVGLPYNLEGYGLIYNKNVFEKAGINAEEIITYDDLEKAVKTLDSKKEELGIEAVFALPGKEKWVMSNHLGNVYLAPEFNHNVLEAWNSPTVAFEKGEEFKRMLDLQAKYSIQPVLNLDYSQQVEQYFSLESVAMIQQGNWVYPSIEQMDADFAENGIGMIPIPVEGLEGHLPVGIPNFWAVNNNKDEKTIQAAKDFLDWLYTSEIGKDYVLNKFKFVPAYEGYDAEQISDPLSRVVYEYSEKGKTIGWIFSGYPISWEPDTFGPNLQKYLDGKMSWDELVEDSIKDWEELRKK